MATTTTNLGLTKPIGTEKALVSVINSNMDIIDNKVGAVPQNESVQSQITALNNQTANIQLTDNELITSETLTGYNTLTNISIASDGMYSFKTENENSSAINLIIDLESKNSVQIYGQNYMSAPQYAMIATPLLYLKAGTYKLRATGTKTTMIKYVYRV